MRHPRCAWADRSSLPVGINSEDGPRCYREDLDHVRPSSANDPIARTNDFRSSGFLVGVILSPAMRLSGPASSPRQTAHRRSEHAESRTRAASRRPPCRLDRALCGKLYTRRVHADLRVDLTVIVGVRKHAASRSFPVSTSRSGSQLHTCGFAQPPGIDVIVGCLGPEPTQSPEEPDFSCESQGWKVRARSVLPLETAGPAQRPQQAARRRGGRGEERPRS